MPTSPTPPVAPDLRWEPTPEDPTVEWTVAQPALGDLYATLTDETRTETVADYDLPVRQPRWCWTVSDARTGADLSEGHAPSAVRAKQAAEATLRSLATRAQ